MQIRAACHRDLETLDGFFRDLLRCENQFDPNIDSDTEVSGNYDQLIGSDGWQIFVAEENGQIVGYCCGFQFQGFARKKPIAILDAIYVAESCRRRGYGRKLVNAFLSWAQKSGAGYVELKVLSGNRAAEKLYESFGFSEVEQKLRCSL